MFKNTLVCIYFFESQDMYFLNSVICFGCYIKYRSIEIYINCFDNIGQEGYQEDIGGGSKEV